MFQILKQTVRIFLLMSFVTGILYPLLVTGVAQLIFYNQANGSLILVQGTPVGARGIAQKFESPRYFWPRPSAVNYNLLSSGGSNLGPISSQLIETIKERKEQYLETPVPQDLIFASASGLDPHISPEAAFYQVERVSKARNMNEEQKKSLVSLIKEHVEGRQWGYLGEPRVNVLVLNLALDKM